MLSEYHLQITIEIALGYDDEVLRAHLLVYQVVGIVRFENLHEVECDRLDIWRSRYTIERLLTKLFDTHHVCLYLHHCR